MLILRNRHFYFMAHIVIVITFKVMIFSKFSLKVLAILLLYLHNSVTLCNGLLLGYPINFNFYFMNWSIP